MFAPTTFGKYYLFEKLATGGMAEIYKGKLLGPGGFEKILVIKQILPELARRREFIEMFVEEAKTTVSLTHGNIVPIYELGVIDGTYYTAMEYIDGPTLHEVSSAAARAGTPIPIDLAVAIVLEVLKGLDYAHRKLTASGGLGVVHRDLSPRNVMVSREGEVKILDFGIAIAGEGGAGELAGSYAYMSPEQANKEPVDARTDLFACGTLLWELITGRQLFARDSPDETLDAVRAAVWRPPSSLRPGVPAEIDEACARALAPKSERAASAQELSRPLQRWLYARAEPPGPKAIAAWLADNLPRGASVSDAPPTQVSLGPGQGTKPVSGRREEVTFATNVQLAEILTHPAEGSEPERPAASTGSASGRELRTVPVTPAHPESRLPAAALPAATAAAPTLAGEDAQTVPRREPRTPVRRYQPTPIMGTRALPTAASAPAATPAAGSRARAAGTGPAADDTTEAVSRARPPSRLVMWIPLALLVLGGSVLAYRRLTASAQHPGPGPGRPPDAGALLLLPDAAVAHAVPPDAALPPDAAPPDAALPIDAGRPRHVDAGAHVIKPRHIDAGVAAPGGTLTVGANPYALVSVDGSRRGSTPLRDLVLPAGSHRLKLVCPPSSCPPSGREFELTVEIVAGGSLRRAVDFTGPEPVIIQ